MIKHFCDYCEAAAEPPRSHEFPLATALRAQGAGRHVVVGVKLFISGQTASENEKAVLCGKCLGIALDQMKQRLDAAGGCLTGLAKIKLEP